MASTRRPAPPAQQPVPIDRLPNPFHPAERVTPHIKLLAYGAPGVGKSYLALGAPGKVAVIDTEGGTVHYAGREGLSPFDALQTRTYRDVRAAFAYLAANPGAYSTVVVDPVTVLYEVLQDAAQLRRAARKGDEDADLEQLDWGRIKRSYKALMTDLVNLPLHVVVTAREKDKSERRGSDLVKVGVTFDAEKGTAYYFDTVLRLTLDGTTRVARVEKDRAAGLVAGSDVRSPTFGGLFDAYLKSDGTAPRHLAPDAEAAAATAPDLTGGPKPAGAKLAATLVVALEDAGLKADELLRQGGWPSFAAMPASTALAWLDRAKKRAAEAEAGEEGLAEAEEPAPAEPVAVAS